MQPYHVYALQFTAAAAPAPDTHTIISMAVWLYIKNVLRLLVGNFHTPTGAVFRFNGWSMKSGSSGGHWKAATSSSNYKSTSSGVW